MTDDRSSLVHPIDKAGVAIDSEPLRAIDLALTAFGATRGGRSESATSHYVEILARAVLSGSGQAGKGDDPVEEMVADAKCERLAVATLLRLLVFDESVFTEDPRLRAATRLFDQALANAIYEDAGVLANQQPFEKRTQLRRHVERHEEELTTHVASLGSLDSLPSFRERLNKLFKARTTAVVIAPFLPRDVTVQSLSEVLASANAVAESDEGTLVAKAEVAANRCAELREKSHAGGTSYSSLILAKLADNVEAAITERLRDRGLADPASLRFELRPKRYPLRNVGSRVALRFDVINSGPGQARDTSLDLSDYEALEIEDPSRQLGMLSPGRHGVAFRGRVVKAEAEDAVLVRVGWRDPDGTRQETEDVLELAGQASEIPWDTLEYEDPFPLEPITDQAQFIGREATLRDLVRAIMASGNARIQGQRRVGKTSLAFAVKARLEALRGDEFAFIYLESGDFNANTAEATIARLGSRIVTQIIQSEPRMAEVASPSFEEGLSPLTEFFETAERLAPERKFVIVLDEFDAMAHPELYQHVPVGDGFFQTLRSLGGKPNLGFVLVGGERMRWVVATHGQVLNKFPPIPLDYFDEAHFEDFRQLVRSPVSEWLEISEAAIRTIHGASAGNPWITKLICRQVFEHHVATRDIDVQKEDVEDAIAEAIPKLGASSFQHFWDDAIRADAEDQEAVSGTRRRVLLAMAMCIRESAPVTREAIVKAARRFDVPEATADEVVQGFLERKILVWANDELHCRVPLFERWLPEEGVDEIVINVGDDDSYIHRQRTQEAARPRLEELKALALRWRTYRGRLVAPDDIRAWLAQFGQPSDQRLMLHLLEGLRYYNTGELAERLKQVHEHVLRDLAARGYTYTRSGRQRRRNDILVCGLEGGGSGANHLLKTYREENLIYQDLVTDTADVPHALERGDGSIRAVVIVEDFIATGSTAKRRLAELHEEWTENRPWPAAADVFLVAVCGFDTAVEKVRSSADPTWLTEVFVGDAMDDGDRCFADDSKILRDPGERDRARALCADQGAVLEPKHPLGFKDSQAAVCFEYRCPNNAPPVLWKSDGGWDALFPRM